MENNFKKFANDNVQPKKFVFDSINLNKAKEILKMYPKNYKESSIMPLLSIAQHQNDGWLPKKAIEYVSEFLDVPEIKVLEIATFYSMYNLSPVGKHHIEICTTSPCMLRGSDNLLEKLKIGLDNTGEITDDNKFSLNRVESLAYAMLPW